MRVKFWGVRGSIPTPLSPKEVEAKVITMAEDVVRAGISDPDKVAGYLRERHSIFSRATVGGNTTCVSVHWGNNVVCLDAGTGIRNLGRALMDGVHGSGGGTVHLLMSHTHWDHIMGFPYFAALFQNNDIRIYGAYDDLEQRFRGQQEPNYYPVSLDIFPADISFHTVQAGTKYPLPDDASFTPISMYHPGGCFAYKIMHKGKIFIFATDTEIKHDKDDQIEHASREFEGADLLVFDSQYTLEESKIKEDWGHSTAVVGVDIAVRAKIKHLVLFHHEPNYPDTFIFELMQMAKRYKNIEYPEYNLKISTAIEGMDINI
ncbi:MBL fold metallo-hydrolase [bacterium]|nr:MBL fold metallo-hydrolase [bacterium]